METGDSRRGIAEVCTTMESVFTGGDEASCVWDEKRNGLLCWATGDGLREKRRKERWMRDQRGLLKREGGMEQDDSEV